MAVNAATVMCVYSISNKEQLSSLRMMAAALMEIARCRLNMHYIGMRVV